MNKEYISKENFKNKVKELGMILLKNIILISIIFILYNILLINGKKMNTIDFTNIGINSVYSEELGKLKIKPEKIMLLTAIVVIMYFSTFKITNNLYQGFKHVIRNKTEHFLEYLKNVYKLYFKYVFLDVFLFIISIFIVMYIVNAERTYTLEVLVNIIKMFLFYISLPFIILMLTDRIEIFIGGIVIFSMLSTLFIYQLNIVWTIICLLIIYLCTYIGLLIKERFN